MEDHNHDEQLIHKLFEQVNQHVETRMTYYALVAAERAATGAANLAGIFTILVFALLVLFFFSMGFAWWLGDFMDNRAAGFALAGLIFIPIAVLVFRWIRPFVRAKIVQSVLQYEDHKNTGQHG